MLRLVPYYGNSITKRQENVNRLVNSFFNAADSLDSAYSSSFPLDVQKMEDHYLITAELPGIDREDISVDIEDNELTIAVNQSSENEEKDEENNYIHRERSSYSAKRMINLGEIDDEKVSASLEDGLLKISIGFKEEIDTRKSIEIE